MQSRRHLPCGLGALAALLVVFAMLTASDVASDARASAHAAPLAKAGNAPAAPVVTKERAEVVVYAAASLRDALGELAPGLEKAAGATCVFNYAGSNDLARQIIAADKADLFISADERWMDKVSDAGLVDRATRRPLLSNRLVVIVPSDSGLKIDSARGLARAATMAIEPPAWIAMADPDAVPAGKYAKAWLEKQGQWSEALRARILATTDVRAALAAVASGNASAGVVYRTDAAVSGLVKVAYEVPEADAPKISYPIAVMAHSTHAAAARKAAEWLSGPVARTSFEKSGFIALGTSAAK